MILVDIPKPKRCLYCPMIDYKRDACIARTTYAGERLSQLEKRPSWCPIIAECDLGGLEEALRKNEEPEGEK